MEAGVTFSSLCLLSCSSSLWVSTSSAFLSSSNALCCALRLASSSSSMTSRRACSTVFPTSTSRMGFTSMSKSKSCVDKGMKNKMVEIGWGKVLIEMNTNQMYTAVRSKDFPSLPYAKSLGLVEYLYNSTLII